MGKKRIIGLKDVSETYVIDYRRLTLLISGILFSIASFTQPDCSYHRPKQADNWCFQVNNLISFSAGSPIHSVLPVSISTGKGCSSISDPDGNLVFYSDGMKLWNRSGDIVAVNLDGDLGSTQSCLFVPDPASSTKYYIFTTDLLYPAPIGTKGLRYSIFDISLNSGNGGIVSLGRKLATRVAEKLCGVMHANGRDVWVIAHEWDSDRFLCYKVTTSGVDSIPVVSQAGTLQGGALSDRTSVGVMKISPDGKKLAQAVLGGNYFEVFDFDASSGKVSNAIKVPSPDALAPYSVEFSPDSRKLYVTTVDISTNLLNNLYQYDLANLSLYFRLNRNYFDVTALQLATDGKIYVARYKKNYLGVIENPNRPDTACNYKEDGFLLTAGQTAQNGLPNVISSYLNIPFYQYETKCHGDITTFSLHNISNIDSVYWSFGEVTAGTSWGLSPSCTYGNPGTYNLLITEWFNGRSFQTSGTVTINPLPPKSFAEDSLYIVPGSRIKLDGGANMAVYGWSDGSSARFLEIDKPGNYWVQIEDKNCCIEADTIKIVLLDLLLPNAFSPNNDGLNDTFGTKGNSVGVDNFSLSIYNKWGQLVWSTNSLGERWDGTFKGELCPADLYSYTMRYTNSGESVKKKTIVKQGNLMLLR